ncbi:DJ-1/PfpI family protein [Treponema pedis]|uniref:DJ-1/PfpI family protein n=1 Tax=Treponema pedis TaxID=409322 RepID=UPI00338E3ABD
MVKSEEGLDVLPNKIINELNLYEYDSLLLPGARDIRSALEDKDIINFISEFKNKIIGAISIAPILFLKEGSLIGKPFMIGANKIDLLEENFTLE